MRCVRKIIHWKTSEGKKVRYHILSLMRMLHSFSLKSFTCVPLFKLEPLKKCFQRSLLHLLMIVFYFFLVTNSIWFNVKLSRKAAKRLNNSIKNSLRSIYAIRKTLNSVTTLWSFAYSCVVVTSGSLYHDIVSMLTLHRPALHPKK